MYASLLYFRYRHKKANVQNFFMAAIQYFLNQMDPKIVGNKSTGLPLAKSADFLLDRDNAAATATAKRKRRRGLSFPSKAFSC